MSTIAKCYEDFMEMWRKMEILKILCDDLVYKMGLKQMICNICKIVILVSLPYEKKNWILQIFCYDLMNYVLLWVLNY